MLYSKKHWTEARLDIPWRVNSSGRHRILLIVFLFVLPLIPFSLIKGIFVSGSWWRSKLDPRGWNPFPLFVLFDRRIPLVVCLFQSLWLLLKSTWSRYSNRSRWTILYPLMFVSSSQNLSCKEILSCLDSRLCLLLSSELPLELFTLEIKVGGRNYKLSPPLSSIIKKLQK